MLKEGDAAPEFTFPDENGELISLASYKGKKTVVAPAKKRTFLLR